MGKELTADPKSRGLTEEDILHIPDLDSRWVRLASGAKAHYVTSGETGPAIILLHGGIVGSSGTAGWRFMAPFLGAHGFRVYCPDRPAFGLADTRPEHRPTMGFIDQVNFITEFADALCLDKFHIGGNSMGGQITVQYVQNYPQRVLSYMLIATTPGDVVPAELRVLGKDSRFSPNKAYAPPQFDGTGESMRILMEGIIYNTPEIWPELIEMRTLAANRQLAAGNNTMLGAGRPTTAPAGMNLGPMHDPNYQQWISTKDRFPKMTLPGIYLYGLQDVLGPVENGFLQEDRLPNLQVFYPDECGHQGQTDQPDMFNHVALEFFKTGKVSWKTAQWAGVSRRREILPNLVEAPAGGFPKPIPEAYSDIDALRKAIAR